MSSETNSSRTELSDTSSNIYRVVHIGEDGQPLWSGQLGITRTELTLYRNGQETAKWPLKCLRRYGYDSDLFSFEAGRRCATGEGIYAFRCRHAESLFQTLQTYIQLNTMNDENPSSSLLGNDVSSSINANLSSTADMPTNYIMPNSRGTLRLSPSVCSEGGVNLQANGGVDGEANYLEPLSTLSNRSLSQFDGSAAPLSPSDNGNPSSPSSPNSVNNILEVTTLNPLPTTNSGNSNIYQENFPTRGEKVDSRENQAKKLSLDIPPQEQAPPVNQSGTSQTMSSGAVRSWSSDALGDQLSPTRSIATTIDSPESMPTYMNVTPGETISTPKFHGVETPTFVPMNHRGSLSNNNSIAMINNNLVKTNFAEANHCYENLEPSEVRPMLLRSQQTRRQSKNDVFVKVDQITASPSASSSIDKIAEPTSPIQRGVNYIVLDLDQTHSQAVNSTGMTPSSSTSPETNNGAITPGSANSSPSRVNPQHNATTPSSASLLVPESPKKGIFDYATIDFNKTVALSNSTTPSMDCEGSRKTRHSSTIVPIVTPLTNGTVPPSHSNSISD